MLGLFAAIVAAPLTTSQALGLLETKAVYKVSPACQRTVDRIVHGTPQQLTKERVGSIACVASQYPQVAAAVDANTGRCAPGADPEGCEAWLVHARSIVLDAIADDGSSASDFAHVMSAMTAIGFGEKVPEAAAKRALASAARLSASHPTELYVQRICLAAWMVIPGGSTEIADVLKRALETGPDDPDILNAVVVLGERAGAVDTASVLVDNVVNSAKAPTTRAYALYLSGCIALLKHDKVAAHDYFTTAAKNDPFDARYSKSVKETAPESTGQARCSLVFSPLSQALKVAIATKS